MTALRKVISGSLGIFMALVLSACSSVKNPNQAAQHIIEKPVQISANGAVAEALRFDESKFQLVASGMAVVSAQGDIAASILHDTSIAPLRTGKYQFVTYCVGNGIIGATLKTSTEKKVVSSQTCGNATIATSTDFEVKGLAKSFEVEIKPLGNTVAQVGYDVHPAK